MTFEQYKMGSTQIGTEFSPTFKISEENHAKMSRTQDMNSKMTNFIENE